MRKMRTFPTSQDNTPRPLLPTRCPCCVTEPAGTACTGEPLPPDLPMGTPVIITSRASFCAGLRGTILARNTHYLPCVQLWDIVGCIPRYPETALSFYRHEFILEKTGDGKADHGCRTTRTR